ncbi:MAG: hypothetical protein JXJ18_09410 [Rhodobacteraceae bacterium]|nr:hypothetical protein [Paracoccaceae bacterium]
MTETDLILPPTCSLSQAAPTRAFRVVSEKAALWFEPRNDVLLVSFDNLASVDRPYPRAPWLHRQAGELGYSQLGVQSMEKDWFRHDTAPAMIRGLQQQGFFQGFSTVVFVGASMGGFAAINFGPLVHGARVLALSPQSTMNTTIAPFERRFTWAVRNSDWHQPAFLDAAAAVPFVPALTVVYDPFVPEDKQHASRLSGANVQMIRLGHATHEAVRVIIKSGALNPMLSEFVQTGQLGPDFWRHMRRRRTVRKWGRSFMDALIRSNHPRLTLRAAEALLRQENYLFAHRAREIVLQKHPELGDTAV